MRPFAAAEASCAMGCGCTSVCNIRLGRRGHRGADVIPAQAGIHLAMSDQNGFPLSRGMTTVSGMTAVPMGSQRERNTCRAASLTPLPRLCAGRATPSGDARHELQLDPAELDD